jgi:hypothetical protein
VKYVNVLPVSFAKTENVVLQIAEKRSVVTIAVEILVGVDCVPQVIRVKMVHVYVHLTVTEKHAGMVDVLINQMRVDYHALKEKNVQTVNVFVNHSVVRKNVATMDVEGVAEPVHLELIVTYQDRVIVFLSVIKRIAVRMVAVELAERVVHLTHVKTENVHVYQIVLVKNVPIQMVVVVYAGVLRETTVEQTEIVVNRVCVMMQHVFVLMGKFAPLEHAVQQIIQHVKTTFVVPEGVDYLTVNV